MTRRSRQGRDLASNTGLGRPPGGGAAVLEVWIPSAQPELHKFTIPITLAL